MIGEVLGTPIGAIEWSPSSGGVLGQSINLGRAIEVESVRAITITISQIGSNIVTCEENKIDSNVVGLSYAEEECLKILPDVTPDSGLQDAGVWWPLEPNDYKDFGGEIKTLARKPITQSRQVKKGVVVDLDASGGFSADFTQVSLQRILQGFMFADARERASVSPINGAVANTLTVVGFTASTNVITVGTGKGVKYSVGMILKSSGMTNPENNFGDAVVTTIAGDVLTVSKTLVTEVSPAGANLEIVGYQFADGEGQIAYNGTTGILTLNKKTGVLPTALNLQVGEWIFIGGDAVGNRFANNVPGYARVEVVSTTAITLREATFTPVTEVGVTGKTVRFFFGRFLKNEATTELIKRRSYQLERTLGKDADGVQSEYLVGAIPNELKIDFKSADKIMCDLSFVAMTNETRTGLVGVKPGTRKPLLVEEAYNTSSDIYRMRLFLTDPTKQTPISLFAFVTEGSLTINNNVKPNKAVGVLGSFASSAGDFEVKGSVEAYFATVAAVAAVKANAECGFNMIGAQSNAGFVFDVPLLTLGGGRVKVEKDEPIMLPLETMAAANSNDYTLGLTFFSYLPNIAMATS